MERRVVELSFCVEVRYGSNADRKWIFFSARSEMLSRLNIALNMCSLMNRRGILVARTDEADGETSESACRTRMFRERSGHDWPCAPSRRRLLYLRSSLAMVTSGS